MQLEKCFRKILEGLPQNAIITDFDVLFNPEYEVDVLKMMVNVCKTRPFSIIWPGKFEEGKLIYAKDGYLDYKEYDVADYDVICVR